MTKMRTGCRRSPERDGTPASGSMGRSSPGSTKHGGPRKSSWSSGSSWSRRQLRGLQRTAHPTVRRPQQLQRVLVSDVALPDLVRWKECLESSGEDHAIHTRHESHLPGWEAAPHRAARKIHSTDCRHRQTTASTVHLARGNGARPLRLGRDQFRTGATRGELDRVQFALKPRYTAIV